MIDPEVPGNCTICPKGTYSLAPDSASCTPCPEGQTTNKEGTTDASFCHGEFIWVAARKTSRNSLEMYHTKC